jgi:hypothetical protein
MRGLGQGGETDKPELCSGRGSPKKGASMKNGGLYPLPGQAESARKVDEGVFLVYLEKREGWVGRAYSQWRLCGTSTL